MASLEAGDHPPDIDPKRMHHRAKETLKEVNAHRKAHPRKKAAARARR
jgi:hypothetical protein